MSFANTKMCSSSASSGTSATSASSSTVTLPALCRRLSATSLALNKKVSMHQFIKSKGKCALKDGNNYNNYSHFSPFAALNDDYYELRPPKIVKTNVTNINALKRRVSAICKIQEELKEMKQREDELRWQRVRYVGLSQPNLNALSDDSDNGVKEDELDSNHTNDVVIIRTNSNPNMAEEKITIEDNSEYTEAYQVGGPRRRIPLIALWEQKIQEEIKLKN